MKLSLVVKDKGSKVINKFVKNAKKRFKGVGKSLRKALSSKIFTKFASAARRGLSGIGKALNALKSIAKGVAIAIAAIATAAVGLGVKAVKEFASFELALANVDTLLDKGSISIKKLADQVLDLPSTLGRAKENVEALYQAVSAGISPENGVTFIAEAAKAATAGLTDTTTAVDIGTTILNAFGLEASRVTDVFDAMFVAVKAGKTTFEELAASVGLVAPTARAVGLSMESMLAIIASLTAQGVKTSIAVTGLKAVLSNIIKPSEEAKKVANRLGIAFSVAGLKAKGFVGFLQDIVKKTGGNIEKIGLLFGSVEALNTVLALTSATGMAKLIDTMDRMEKKLGATAAAFEKIADTLSFAFKGLGSAINKVFIEIGKIFAPTIKRIVSGLTQWIDANRKLIALKVEEYVFKLKDRILALIETVKKFMPEIKEAWTAIKRLIPTLKGAAIAGWAFLIFLSGATLPFTLLGNAIGLIIGQFSKWKFLLQDFTFTTFLQALKAIPKLMLRMFKDTLQAGWDWLREHFQILNKWEVQVRVAITHIKERFMVWIDFIKAIPGLLKQVAIDAAQFFADGFNKLPAPIKKIFITIKNIVVGIVKTIVNTVSKLISGMINKIKSAAAAIKGFFGFGTKKTTTPTTTAKTTTATAAQIKASEAAIVSAKKFGEVLNKSVESSFQISKNVGKIANAMKSTVEQNKEFFNYASGTTTFPTAAEVTVTPKIKMSPAVPFKQGVQEMNDLIGNLGSNLAPVFDMSGVEGLVTSMRQISRDIDFGQFVGRQPRGFLATNVTNATRRSEQVFDLQLQLLKNLVRQGSQNPPAPKPITVNISGGELLDIGALARAVSAEIRRNEERGVV